MFFKKYGSVFQFTHDSGAFIRNVVNTVFPPRVNQLGSRLSPQRDATNYNNFYSTTGTFEQRRNILSPNRVNLNSVKTAQIIGKPFRPSNVNSFLYNTHIIFKVIQKWPEVARRVEKKGLGIPVK